jgi:hypothetical protein
MSKRLSTTALVLAIVANAPLLAFTIVFALVLGIVGGNVGVFASLADVVAAIGPIPLVIVGGISAVALVLGVVAAARGHRDGITAAGIAMGTPVLCFVILAVLALV